MRSIPCRTEQGRVILEGKRQGRTKEEKRYHHGDPRQRIFRRIHIEICRYWVGGDRMECWVKSVIRLLSLEAAQ